MAYSTWQEILFAVPQGSILGPLLFNIHMCDLFFVVESVDIASYSDETTPYICLEDIDLIIEKLEVKANEIFQWFNENAMKANANKCHLLITTNEERNISIGGKKYKIVKLKSCLGLPLIINCLSLSIYIKSVIKLVKKLNALTRFSSFMS